MQTRKFIHYNILQFISDDLPFKAFFCTIAREPKFHYIYDRDVQPYELSFSSCTTMTLDAQLLPGISFWDLRVRKAGHDFDDFQLKSK